MKLESVQTFSYIHLLFLNFQISIFISFTVLRLKIEQKKLGRSQTAGL
jgi:hypothetical protein